MLEFKRPSLDDVEIIKEKFKNVDKFGKITVGNNCFIGCRSIIMPNVTIGNNCVVGSGSVVTKSIPDGEVWAGNPAHFITTIDKYTEKLINIANSEEQKELKRIVMQHQK